MALHLVEISVSSKSTKVKCEIINLRWMKYLSPRTICYPIFSLCHKLWFFFISLGKKHRSILSKIKWQYKRVGNQPSTKNTHLNWNKAKTKIKGCLITWTNLRLDRSRGGGRNIFRWGTKKWRYFFSLEKLSP